MQQRVQVSVSIFVTIFIIDGHTTITMGQLSEYGHCYKVNEVRKRRAPTSVQSGLEKFVRVNPIKYKSRENGMLDTKVVGLTSALYQPSRPLSVRRCFFTCFVVTSLGRHSVSNNRQCEYLFNSFRQTTKNTKARLTSPSPVDSPHKSPIMHKAFPYRDVIMSDICSYITVTS